MAVLVSRRVLSLFGPSKTFGHCDCQSLRIADALNAHASGDNLFLVESSTSCKIGSSFLAYRRLSTSILTPEFGEVGFPSELLSKKIAPTPPEHTLGLYQDLVIPVTNFYSEDKGLMVLAGDVFDVPIRKDIVHRIVRWQLVKQQEVCKPKKKYGVITGIT